jgi:hypothetical protein
MAVAPILPERPSSLKTNKHDNQNDEPETPVFAAFFPHFVSNSDANGVIHTSMASPAVAERRRVDALGNRFHLFISRPTARLI